MLVVTRRTRLLLAGMLLAALAALGGARLAREVRYRGHLHEAERALAGRDFAAAGRHLDACLAARPRDLPARLLAAQAARRRGDRRAALAHLRAYKAGGGSAEAVELEQRLLRVQQGDLAEAGMMLAFCEQHPDAPETPLVLEALIENSLKALLQAFRQEMASQGREDLVDVAQAQRAVDQWLRLRPDRADQVQGLVWAGQLQGLARDYPRARALFRQALALDPNHFQARLSLAELLVREAPEEAAAHLERLREREPGNNHLRLRLATVRRGRGQLEDARRLLDELLAAQPDNVPALIERGRVALDEQHPAEGERWLRRAFARAPDRPDVNLALAHCLQQRGKAAEAKRYHERFEQLLSGRNRKSTPGP